MADSMGPTPVTIGGRTLILSKPDPVLVSGVFDFAIQKGMVDGSSLRQVKSELAGLPPELAAIAIKTAIECDHADRRRKINQTPELPRGMLLDPEVCAMLLQLLAVEHQPTFTMADALECVKKEGVVRSIALIGYAMPGDDEKKSPGSSPSLPGGDDSTGPDASPGSAKHTPNGHPEKSTGQP